MGATGELSQGQFSFVRHFQRTPNRIPDKFSFRLTKIVGRREHLIVHVLWHSDGHGDGGLLFGFQYGSCLVASVDIIRAGGMYAGEASLPSVLHVPFHPAQTFVHRLQIEFLRMELPASRPTEVCEFIVPRLEDDLQELLIA